jgi:3-isopropylmalate/(R)-2-methylmalate dehydratase large subunit
MPMTITEKILAKHCGKTEVKEGEFIEVDIDVLLGNDITAPLAIEKFREWGGKRVFDSQKIVLVPDHSTPNKDIRAAQQSLFLRKFVREQGIVNYFEVGRVGIEHILLPEKGLVLPGDLVIGADSHTCTAGALGAFACGVGSTDLAAAMLTGRAWLKVPSTIRFVYRGELRKWVTAKDLILYTIGDIGVEGASYKSMEFGGEVISRMSMAGRLTMCNMVVEAGAKNGIIEPDEITLNYIRRRSKREYHLYNGDPEAEYLEVKEYEVSQLEPQVAFPSLPSNTKGISQIGKIQVDQVVIGSCTNGHFEDLKIAAELLKGKKICPEVRLIVIPATPSIYLEALKKGLLQVFLEAGAVISPPTCGPCLGGHMGVLGEGEVAVSTTNRNFVGRMGHLKSKVYLTGPAVAAASAIKGRIASPEEVI